jgi:uncharacterized repeat protein (TIGR03803 family)
MRALIFRSIAAAVIAAAVLAAVGEARAQSSPVIYRFKGGKEDGANPHASLIYVEDALYGTTKVGGSTGCGGAGCGTLFRMTLTGIEKAHYSFAGGSRDGAQPYGALIYLKNENALYGTTYAGGGTACAGPPVGCGTVFKILRQLGRETAPGYTFRGGEDGSGPDAGLYSPLETGPLTLFGTSSSGGTNGLGTVFKVTEKGKFVLYRFKGGKDGSSPVAGLTDAGGGSTLYGTTLYGGGTGCFGAGCGTVFKVTEEGEETPLHRFAGGIHDGAWPYGDLIYVHGMFYGTTANGGGKGCGGLGCGTVFKMTEEGKVTILHFFQKTGDTDGALPAGGLIALDGELYGTTAYGGGKGSCINGGCGTVFKLPIEGDEDVIDVLYRFKGRTDGANPFAGLIEVYSFGKGEWLYGTTYAGGGAGCGGSGCGTVFKVEVVDSGARAKE